MRDRSQFPMAVTTGSTSALRTGTWRSFRPAYVQHTPPCREACPAGEDTARWIDLLRASRCREAWEILVEDNPFPAAMGRICPHPCEAACNRAEHDAPMAIGALEQFLGDLALAQGWPLPAPAPERPQQAAVVGGGPSGLSCAYQLRRLGYSVTLFEAGAEPGGNLLHALPAFDLPAGVVRAEIRRILDLGVEVRTGLRVGPGGDLTWDALLAEFDAVYLAIGAPRPLTPDLPGADLPGVVDGLALLRAVKAGDRPALAPGAPAVVIGAGLTGLAAARTLRRLGAAVTLVTTEPADSLAEPGHWAAAAAEGIALVGAAAVGAVIGRAGRAAAVGVGDAELPADLVVMATGRTPDLEHLPETCSLAGWHVAADALTGETGTPGLFAGGDAASARGAAAAVGAGKRAAAAIDAWLRGRGPADDLGEARLGHSPHIAMRRYARPESYPAQVQVRLRRVISYADINSLYFDRAARTEPEWRAPAERVQDFAEARLPLSEAGALLESRRCFSCGTCIGCENCLIFCPDMAIRRNPDGPGFTVNWDYCKGCGACVEECPREAMSLEEECK